MNIQTHIEHIGDPKKQVMYVSSSLPTNLVQKDALDPMDGFLKWYNKKEEDRLNKQMDKVIAEYYS